MRATIATVIGTIISLGALAAWLFVAPAAGAGWILLVAFVGTLSILCSINKPVLAAIASLIVSGAAGMIWYFHQQLPLAKLVLVLSIIAGCVLFNSLNDIISDAANRDNQAHKSHKSKK